MKKSLLLMILGLLLVSAPAFAKDKKPMRPARNVSANANLYALVWRCTFTVTPEKKTTAACVPGKFNNARKFLPIPATKEHRTISNRAARFLSGVYGNETFPYADAKSKKPIPRPELCEFELTHGETSEPADTAVIRARAGVCPLTTPSEQFLFQELLLDGLDQIVYERGEIPGGLTEDND